MDNDNIRTTKNMTLEELERELEHDRIVDRELNDTDNSTWMIAFMVKIERLRFERQKAFPQLSQKKLAEMAGIGLSTYTDYVAGRSDNIKLKTVINIAHALGCKPSDLMG